MNVQDALIYPRATYLRYTASVNTSKLVSELDKEINRLREARNLLAADTSSSRRTRKPGKKRVLTAEARAKMAAAQKRRWAAYRKKSK
jgi:hypothetical protein